MRILLLAVLLSGCGSACSSSFENGPEPASPSQASKAEPSAPAPSAGEPRDEADPEPAPAPPPKPVDPEDERVVYANEGVRSKVRFAPLDDLLLVADVHDEGETPERLSLRDPFGQVRWSHDYARIDDVALDAEGAYATADGHLYGYDLESGEPSDLGQVSGDLVLTPSHVYVHSLGVVKRVPREGGPAQKVVEHPKEGFHRIDVQGEKLAMLASAFRNRPARFPKLGALLTAPAKGGALHERFTAMYSPGPVLDLDGEYAYFGASAKGEEGFEYRLVRIPLEGRAGAQVVVHHPIAVFAVEDGQIYAAARLDDRVGLFAFFPDDRDPVLLSEFEGGATRVALSDDYVYWESRGTIYRVDKTVPEPPPEPAEEAEEEPGAQAPAQPGSKPSAPGKKAGARAKPTPKKKPAAQSAEE